MQNVSKEYKKSMRATAQTISRNRGYIRVYIGVINQQAQKGVNASDERNSFTYFSNVSKPFNAYLPDNLYATCEQKFSLVDGSMRFLPQSAGDIQYNNGLVTEEILGTIYINFGGLTDLDIKGLTIDFGHCYPVDFSVEYDSGTNYYTGNDKSYWSTEDVFRGVSYFKIIPSKMAGGQDRLRIYQFMCGIANTFTNKEVISYSMKEYVSSISDTIPSNDMNLTVDNQNLYYSPDNPDSALSFMELGQEVRIAFGYDTYGTGDIEWLPENTVYLKNWTADDKQAKFTATDRFDNTTGTYYRGLFRPQGISLYELALDVIHDAGITDEREYFIDPYLKNVVVQNPVPAVSHMEALQIIANAGRCVLYEDRSNRIHLQASFVPDMEISVNNETEYSHIGSVLNNDKEKAAYAICSNDFSVADGSLFFMPTETDYKDTGYISKSLCNENGVFEEEPLITINLEAAFVAFGLLIRFRNVAPQEFHVITYYHGIMVNDMTVENPDTEYTTYEQFDLFDRMEILFTKGHPNSRITIDSIIIGDVTDYVIGRNDMHSSPVATRQNKVKSINVQRSIYGESKEEIKDLSQEEIVLNPQNSEYTVYFSNPSYGLSVRVEENESIQCEILESSNYFARLNFKKITEEIVVKYVVSGYEYTVENSWLVSPQNANGEIIEWKNPLISSTDQARDLIEWLGSYHLGDIDYKISWRGDPRTDGNDLYYLELKNSEKVLVRGYETLLKFQGGAWSGELKARKAVL